MSACECVCRGGYALQEGKRLLFIAGWRPPSPGMWPHKGPLSPVSHSARAHSGGGGSALPGPLVWPGDPGQVPVHPESASFSSALSAVEDLGGKQMPCPDGLPLCLHLTKTPGCWAQWCKPGVSAFSWPQKENQEFKARLGGIASSRLAQTTTMTPG